MTPVGSGQREVVGGGNPKDLVWNVQNTEVPRKLGPSRKGRDGVTDEEVIWGRVLRRGDPS